MASDPMDVLRRMMSTLDKWDEAIGPTPKLDTMEPFLVMQMVEQFKGFGIPITPQTMTAYMAGAFWQCKLQASDEKEYPHGMLLFSWSRLARKLIDGSLPLDLST